jgi:hypothetical protein
VNFIENATLFYTDDVELEPVESWQHCVDLLNDLGKLFNLACNLIGFEIELGAPEKLS